ncbi:carboxylating nicotinate-nucleotide diphosphorylase [bacterium SCSIO 12741]|nr:carboxylating nicotinate-nucleotide diphosphorylase [bacterium SCSIO 12741]
MIIMTLTEHINLALREDIREEDHSSASCIPQDAQSAAVLIAKQEGILAGVEVAREVFKQVDSELKFEALMEDGDTLNLKDRVFTVKGSARSILKGERLALNYLQRMSGIATHTHSYVELVKGTKAKILDTRKTTPGMRLFEKAAVKIGGGENHRMGLYDMVMLKDNHIDFAGGIDEAMDATESYLNAKGLNLKVEVEARDLEEVAAILKNGKADRVMFDNFNYEDTRKGVELVAGRMEIESSGGINLNTVKGYAECGVDFISVGALTHQIKALDLSLIAD